jgi:UDP-glucose 4-epimerase
MPAPDGPVAVTGAGGYLGGRVASALGEEARAIVRTPVPWLPARTQVTCDLLGPADDLARALDGVAAVVHLAGHNEVVAGRDPDTATRETVQMAENVRRAATANGVRRIVYVSTVHVYGERLVPGARLDESIEPAPTSAYARARWECEQVLAADPAVEVVRLRLTNAVGAPADPSVDRWTLVASDLCRQGVLERRMVLHSAGLQWRDFVALEDACRLALGSLDDAVAPGTYNLGAGRSWTIRALAELVQERVEASCGWRPPIEAPPALEAPTAPYVVAPDKLAAAGLRATTPLVKAVDELVEHCKQHDATLRDVTDLTRN